MKALPYRNKNLIIGDVYLTMLQLIAWADDTYLKKRSTSVASMTML
ncbi:MAG: hypothetical protein MUE44_01370 [Oscillatoriaceae cyanobacterium Prado104]|nr:hypothetical protein [Oscillatoriaceae cyanobacterium Prado104]